MYSAPKLTLVDCTSGAKMSSTNAEITQMLHDWSDGETGALDNLMPLVFDDLRKMAGRYLRRERFHTLQSTALVHEVFLRLLQRNSVTWQNRSQFYGFVATEMRRILVDRARKKNADRRGGGQQPLSLDQALEVAADRDIDLAALDAALGELAELEPDLCQVVELRFFVGLSYSEIADIQDTSVATVRRRWDSARTWLYRELAASNDRFAKIAPFHRGQNSPGKNSTT